MDAHSRPRRTRAVIAACTAVALVLVFATPALGAGPKRSQIRFKYDNYTVKEGANAVVTLQRSPIFKGGSDASVEVVAEDISPTVGVTGACAAGADYLNQSPYLASFTGFESTTSVLIFTCDKDDVYTGDRLIQLTLRNFVGGQPSGNTTAFLTIQDDDPALSIGDASATEGGTAQFTVSTSKPAGVPIAFTWAASPWLGTSPDPAEAADYLATATGVGVIPAYAWSTTVDVPVFDDFVDEANEAFIVSIWSPDPSWVGLVDPWATGMILDDDAMPFVYLTDPTVEWEGSTYSFSARLSQVSERQVTVMVAPHNAFSTADGYDKAALEMLTIPAGSLYSTTPLNLVVSDDAHKEWNEYLYASITSAVNATTVGYLGDASAVDSFGFALVRDNDAASIAVTLDRTPTWSITAPQGQTDHISVFNLSSDAIPNMTVRVEIWRDRDAIPNGYLDLVADGTSSTGPTGVLSGSWTSTETGIDYVEACVPGTGVATLTSCGLVQSDGGLGGAGLLNVGEDTLLSPPPGNTLWSEASFTWTP